MYRVEVGFKAYELYNGKEFLGGFVTRAALTRYLQYHQLSMKLADGLAPVHPNAPVISMWDAPVPDKLTKRRKKRKDYPAYGYEEEEDQ